MLVIREVSCAPVYFRGFAYQHFWETFSYMTFIVDKSEIFQANSEINKIEH